MVEERKEEATHETKFSFMSDEEYLHYLYSMADPSDENVESALRIELLLNTYESLLEQIHTLAVKAMENPVHLAEIKRITAPKQVGVTIQ